MITKGVDKFNDQAQLTHLLLPYKTMGILKDFPTTP